MRHVRGVETHEVPAPEQAADDTVASVRKLCDFVRPAAVLPLDDNALWVCRQLNGLDAPIAGATDSAVDCALDKSVQLQVACDAGLPVPQTRILSDFAIGEQPSFPVMVKPALALYEVDGALQRPTGIVCGNPEEFARAAARLWPGAVLVQSLIRGTGEGLFGHVGADGVIGWSAHRRVRMVNPQGSASSACQSQPVDEELIGPSERFLRAIGWQGLFMLEFLRDAEGTPWFMELNGRAWGVWHSPGDGALSTRRGPSRRRSIRRLSRSRRRARPRCAAGISDLSWCTWRSLPEGRSLTHRSIGLGRVGRFVTFARSGRATGSTTGIGRSRRYSSLTCGRLCAATDAR